jgi:dUTP pyrophosphatase
MKKIEVFIEICRDGMKIPKYANLNDAGADVISAEDVIIAPMETKIIPTGIKVAIPEGYEIQVRPRSGISYKTPLRVSNSPGTIDAGFRDEIGVIMTNTSVCDAGQMLDLNSKGNQQGTYKIKKGDRVAQIVLHEVPMINWVVTDDVKSIGSDRNGGFGSTGVIS